MPVYYVIAILYIIFLGRETILQNIIIAPIEILGLQSAFSSLFGYSHNGGTWFISCILLCYVFFPLIQNIVKQMEIKYKAIVFIINTAVLLYSPFIVHVFKTSWIYSNPFFRILEFMDGILLAGMFQDFKKIKFICKILFNKAVILFECVLLVIGVTILYKAGIACGDYMLYSVVCLPLFCLMLPALAYIKLGSLDNSKIIKYLSQISYCFFLAQFFVWPLIRIMEINNNVLKIVISVILCVIIAVVLNYFIEKPVKKWITG